MRLRSLILAFLAVVLVAFPLTARATPPATARLAYVDMEAIYNRFDEAKAVRARLKTTLETKSKLLQLKRDELKKLEEAVDKETSPERKKKLQEELQAKAIAFQQSALNQQTEMAEAESKAMEAVDQKIDKAVAKVAERDRIDWVFDKGRARYTGAAFDITNDVIAVLTTKTP